VEGGGGAKSGERRWLGKKNRWVTHKAEKNKQKREKKKAQASFVEKGRTRGKRTENKQRKKRKHQKKDGDISEPSKRGGTLRQVGGIKPWRRRKEEKDTTTKKDDGKQKKKENKKNILPWPNAFHRPREAEGETKKGVGKKVGKGKKSIVGRRGFPCPAWTKDPEGNTRGVRERKKGFKKAPGKEGASPTEGGDRTEKGRGFRRVQNVKEKSRKGRESREKDFQR